MNTQAHHILLEGSNYEAGIALGNICKKIPGLTDAMRMKEEFITKQDEAILWTRNMPIAFNIYMLVVDKSGDAALIESFNGIKAVKKIDALSKEQFICSTNHVHLPELEAYTPKSMNNSCFCPGRSQAPGIHKIPGRSLLPLL